MYMHAYLMNMDTTIHMTNPPTAMLRATTDTTTELISNVNGDCEGGSKLGRVESGVEGIATVVPDVDILPNNDIQELYRY